MVFATPNNKCCFHFVLQCKCDICKHSIRMIFFRLQIKICQQDQLDKIHCNGLFTWGKLTELGELAHLREGIFISLSYGIFYLTAKSLLRHWKKIAGIYRFSIWLPEGSSSFILLYAVLWIWSLFFLFFCNLIGFYLQQTISNEILSDRRRTIRKIWIVT